MPQPPAVLRLSDITVDRRDSGGMTRILDLPELQVAAGARVGITGPSGAGKTTLLEVIAGIVPPTNGVVLWGYRAVSKLSEREARPLAARDDRLCLPGLSISCPR